MEGHPPPVFAFDVGEILAVDMGDGFFLLPELF